MSDDKKIFGGNSKVGSSILLNAENALKRWIVPRIPRSIETYHLTMLTLLWSVLILTCGYLAKFNLNWLWAISLLIFLQYLTDLLDGELGRYRNTGLIKWGFYMDHFFDYLFLCSLVSAGYMISPPGLEAWYVALMVALCGFMTASFLSFAATNKFEIYHMGMGPTEGRVVLILVNTFIIYRGTGDFYYLLPITVASLFVALALYVYRTHRSLWDLDMTRKALDQPKD